MIILITYDIEKDSSRTKLHKLLKDYGHWVQRSVFELMLDWDRIEELKVKINEFVKGERDSVRFYQVCDACRERIRISGKGEKFLNDEVEIF